jgi:hypothetical protein
MGQPSVGYLEEADTDVSSYNESVSEPCSDVCVNDQKKLWKDGIVPYEFDNNVSMELKTIVKYAMKAISKVSSIRFVIKTDQLDYVKIVDKDGYWSYVGKQGGKQVTTIFIYNSDSLSMIYFSYFILQS